ncbi:hypothetical protein [Actinokineospora sp.]|uniref:hypothetical protein n=1 Tax=Actinokineospora sp. TaxID=1872133 RepID=UPI003D6BA762
MTDTGNVDNLLKSLRSRVEELEENAKRDRADIGRCVSVAALAGALFALTASTWFVLETKTDVTAYSLWGLWGLLGWPAFAVVAVLAVVAVGSLTMAMAAPGKVARWVQLAAGVLLVPAMIWCNASLPGKESAWSAAAWVTLLCAGALTLVNGTRISASR